MFPRCCAIISAVWAGLWLISGFSSPRLDSSRKTSNLNSCLTCCCLLLQLVHVVQLFTLFTFVFSWNEVMFSLTFGRTETRTITKLFQSLLQSPTGIFFGPAAASVVLGVIPAYVLTLFFQRYLVRGLSFGSVK